MRFILDENIDLRLAQFLEERGHQVISYWLYLQGFSTGWRVIGLRRLQQDATRPSSSIEEGSELRNNLLGYLFHEPMPSSGDDDTFYLGPYKPSLTK